MASRSPSRSEGEVLSSESEAKANKSPSSKYNTKIDRPPRPRSPPPRSLRSRSRSRSRSPYRAPRGEKRRREGDYTDTREPARRDPRTFTVKHDRRYPPHDHHESKRSRTYSRSRSRSRSPYRHSRLRVEKQKSDAVRTERDRKPEVKRGDYVEAKFPARRENRPIVPDNSLDSSARNDHYEDKTRLGSDGETTNLRTVNAKRLPDDEVADANIKAGDFPNEGEMDGNPVMGEAALIEARRKRREAIKNRYRGQATPLLVQALQLGTEPSTPGPDSLRSSPARSVSPAGSTPRTPQESGPASPATMGFGKDEDLANSDIGSPAEDEPSAADYDPTVDMEEERARHDKRMFKEDEQSIADAERHIVDSNAESNRGKVGDTAEFDMFAEEDDDNDMFAELPTKPNVGKKTAHALDVTMMDNWDDPDGYYITMLGELIENRYHVTQNLGRGMFSSVVRATDSTTGQPVAIKIVRQNETMRKAGAKEIDILKDIAANDPDDKKHVIRLRRFFEHKGHLCMVFENLSLNLREVLKKFGRDVGINLKAIRVYGQQLFLGLSLLKKCQYLHADLKPDNILVNEGRNLLKICDLGSASPITENATAPYLVSRFYRAPEVILGISYDYGIDMWSVGCTLFELYTGKILFTGRNNNNMLRAVMECRGKFPHKLLRRGTLVYDHFDDLLNFRSLETDKVTGRPVTRIIDIKAKPVRDLRSRLLPKGKKVDEQERKELELFVDLLDKCLDLRPEKRVTPSEALKHPFILRVKS